MKEWTDMILRGMRIFWEMGLHDEFRDIVLISGGRRMFLEVLYRSMTAGGTILVILLLRVLLKRMPKRYFYLLWILVLYRLLCPFTLVSSCSLLGMLDREDTGQVLTLENSVFPEVEAGETAPNNQAVWIDTVAADVGQDVYDGIHLSRNLGTVLWVAFHIWIVGVILILLYGIGSLLYFNRRLKGAVRVRDNIYLSDYIPTAFVIGIIQPRIYLPSSLTENEWEYVILHERTHIRRGDHIIRILSFVTLAVYWFHPLIWAAFYLSGKDMEMSCDEAVMRKMDRDIRAEYSTSLLQLSAGRKFSGGIPLAFGEKDVKKRIENVMRWRKPKPAVACAALTVLGVAVVILGTDPMPTWAGSDEVRQAADAWAQAVCDRDGDQIAALCTAEKREQMMSEELLYGEEGNYGFGWSSPWPWDSQKDYRIMESSPRDTVILYYAWTSEPHVTVWQEHLTWRQENGGYLVEESGIIIMNDLSDCESFSMAYKAGINGTPMDYLTNGAGEALNENALEERGDSGGSRYYQGLFMPQTAARSLLNISEDAGKVMVRAGEAQADGSVKVIIDFVEEGVLAEMTMIQPYGTDGIWIPRN